MRGIGSLRFCRHGRYVTAVETLSGFGFTIHRDGGVSLTASGGDRGGISLLWGKANRRVWRNARDVQAYGVFRREGERLVVFGPTDPAAVDWPALDQELPSVGLFVGSDY